MRVTGSVSQRLWRASGSSGHILSSVTSSRLLALEAWRKLRLRVLVWCSASSTGKAASDSKVEESQAYREALPFEKIPKVGGLAAIPFIGTRFLFKPFGKHPVECLDQVVSELHEVHGPIYRMRFGKGWQVNVDRLEDAKIVFFSEGEYPYRQPLTIAQVYMKRAKVPLNVLTVLNGEEWRRLRTSMNARMMRANSASHYLPAQEQVAEEFADRFYHLQSKGPDVLADLFFAFAADGMGVVCFNKRPGFLDEDVKSNDYKKKLLASYRTLFRGVYETLFGKRFLYMLYDDAFFREYREAKETILEHTRECVKESMEELARREKEGNLDPEEPNFLLSILSEKTLSENDVFSIVYNVMSSGAESTACTLQLLFYALAANPDKQEKVAEEVLTHMGPDGHLTAPVLDKMVYMQAAVKESLRFYFPLPMAAPRLMENSAVLSGYQVPKGTMVAVNSCGMAHSSRCYDQPHLFLPERWLRDEDGQRGHDISTLAYLPFGFGLRNCIGRRFALQELYLATAKVLQKYHIGLSEDCPELETICTPFRAPKHPLPFTLTQRQ